MTKQTFTIPEGCKAVTVEQVDNQIITTFEPEFKRGDVLISKGGGICVLDEITNKNQAVEIIGLIGNKITHQSKPYYFDNTQRLRLATPEEARPLWDALAKEGKRWNPETMKVDEIKKERWRAKNDGIYYSVDISTTRLVYYLEECGDAVDNRNYTSGNYFQTEEQAKRAADRLKAELDKFWEEELI